MAFIAFSGCVHRVSVSHLLCREASFDPATLSHAYLILHAPALADGAAAGLDVDLLARRFAAHLRTRGGSLVAYRVQTAQDADPFAPLLKPSAVLQVRMESPLVGEEETVEKDTHHWVRTGQVRIGSELLSAKGEAPFVGAPVLVSTRMVFRDPESERSPSQSQEWVTAFTEAVAQQAVEMSIPLDTVTRWRPLYAVKGDTASVTAVEAGEGGRWEAAVPTWKAGLATHPMRWQNAWNLAVWAEKQQNIPRARMYFDKARDLAARDPKAPSRDTWKAVEADLDRTVQPPTTDADRLPAWFHRTLAVLPFSDESTSIDGPLHVRRLTRQALLKAGYQALPLQQVDKVLKEHGLTQGGHLATVRPETLATWLEVDGLIYGHLEKFDEVTLGLVGWKRVAGTMKLWDRESRTWLWQSSKAVSHAQNAKAFTWAAVGSSLWNQLAGSWSDKAQGQPMAIESAAYVDQQVGELPHKP